MAEIIGLKNLVETVSSRPDGEASGVMREVGSDIVHSF